MPNLLFQERAHADGTVDVDTRFIHSYSSSVSAMDFFTVKHSIDNVFSHLVYS